MDNIELVMVENILIKLKEKTYVEQKHYLLELLTNIDSKPHEAQIFVKINRYFPNILQDISKDILICNAEKIVLDYTSKKKKIDLPNFKKDTIIEKLSNQFKGDMNND